jgi:hypothetical protein
MCGRAPGSRKIQSIAVLPIRNLSGDPAQEYFSDGITEELIATLAQIHDRKVISRASVVSYKGSARQEQDGVLETDDLALIGSSDALVYGVEVLLESLVFEVRDPPEERVAQGLVGR